MALLYKGSSDQLILVYSYNKYLYMGFSYYIFLYTRTYTKQNGTIGNRIHCKYIWIWMRFRMRTHQKPCSLRFASCALCCGICCGLRPGASMPQCPARKQQRSGRGAHSRLHGFSCKFYAQMQILCAIALILSCCTQVKLLKTRCGCDKLPKYEPAFSLSDIRVYVTKQCNRQ